MKFGYGCHAATPNPNARDITQLTYGIQLKTTAMAHTHTHTQMASILASSAALLSFSEQPDSNVTAAEPSGGADDASEQAVSRSSAAPCLLTAPLPQQQKKKDRKKESNCSDHCSDPTCSPGTTCGATHAQ